jgi:hypothetical protein
MNQHTKFRKNNKFFNGLEEIREYFRGHHGQIPEELNLFWDTIFPRPEMNDNALSKRVTKEEKE